MAGLDFLFPSQGPDSILDPMDARRLFGVNSMMTGLGLIANANAPLALRQPIPSLLFQGMNSYQQGLRDLQSARTTGQYLKLAQAEEERRRKEFEAAQAAAAQKQAEMERQRQLREQLIPTLPPEQQPWAQAYPDIFGKEAVEQMFAPPKDPKAPEVRNFIVGGREVPHQYDFASGQWVPIEGTGGPRWQPPTPLDRVEAEAAARARGEAGVKAMLPPEPKTALNFMLPDKRVVLSHDGGMTYRDPDTGQTMLMPSTAVRLGVETGAAEARGAEGVRQARQAGQPPEGTGAVPDPAKAAREGGTGTYSRIAAVIDAIMGGLDIDSLFGSDGFFPETQANRQELRALKQTAKSALLNSARGAVWEQQKIDELFPDPDKFWANPSTEARKIETMRDALVTERTYNLNAMASGALSPDEMAKFRASNFEIERALTLMGYNADGSRATPPPITLPDLGKTITLPSGATIRRVK